VNDHARLTASRALTGRPARFLGISLTLLAVLIAGGASIAWATHNESGVAALVVASAGALFALLTCVLLAFGMCRLRPQGADGGPPPKRIVARQIARVALIVSGMFFNLIVLPLLGALAGACLAFLVLRAPHWADFANAEAYSAARESFDAAVNFAASGGALMAALLFAAWYWPRMPRIDPPRAVSSNTQKAMEDRWDAVVSSAAGRARSREQAVLTVG
jgi:hypothetical protein